jgi:hypothetical protein
VRRPSSNYLKSVRKDPVAPLSQIGRYLNEVRSMGQDGAESAALLEADLIETFSTETGLRVLIMLEKAVLHVALPPGSPEGALREINAQRNLVLEIRRIVANG